MIGRRALLLGLAAAKCSRPRPSLDAGRAARIVSLSPSTTEAVAAVGALSELVGRSRFCNYPPDVRGLPQVGGYVDPNLEAILALAPTLVVGARGPGGSAVAAELAARGTETYFPETESLAQIEEMIIGIGERTKRQAGARDVVRDIQHRVDRVVRLLLGASRPRAILLLGVRPVVAAGARTFATELLTLAGAENVVSGAGYPTLDMEALLALDPDVVLNAASSEEHGAERIPIAAPGWRALRAVREERIVVVTDETVLRPGPRIGDGLTVLARALHGEMVPPP